MREGESQCTQTQRPWRRSWFWLCIVVATVLTAQAHTHAEDPAPPVVRGDVNRNQAVDLRDLAELSANWNDTENLYVVKAESLQQALIQHWGETVPGAVASIGWERVARQNGPAYSLKSGVKTRRTPANKGGLFQAIGVGIDYPKNTPGAIPTRQIYNAPFDKLVPARFQALPGGFTESGTLRPRYDFPVDSSTTEFTYCSSYSEELDVLGFDLSAEAKYTAFSGSVSFESKREEYSNLRQHKVLFRAFKSFGWFFLPEDQIDANLTQSFIDDLADPTIQDLTEIYGSHYTYAEHRGGELIIEIAFSTVRNESRAEMKAKAEAHFSGATTSGAFAAKINTLSQSINGATNVRVTVSRRGGSANLLVDTNGDTVPDTSIDEAVISQSTGSNLVAIIAACSGAWSADLNAGNAAAFDWHCRPLTDFYNENMLPFSREASMRNWFTRYLELDTQLSTLKTIIDSDAVPPVVVNAYRYLKKANPQNFGVLPNGQSMEEYLVARLDLTQSRYDAVFALGKEIYFTKDAENPLIFDRQNPDYALPKLELPSFGATVITQSQRWFEYSPASGARCPTPAEDATPFYWNGNITVPNALFLPEENYVWRVIQNTDVTGLNPAVFVSAPGAPRWTLTPSNDGTSSLLTAYYAVWASSKAPQCWEPFRDWLNASEPGVAFGLFDNNSNVLVTYICPDGTCDSVNLEQFNTIGKSDEEVQ